MWTMNTVVLFEGRNSVHHLYDFLLNTHSRRNDVPLLISPSPFLKASFNTPDLSIASSAKDISNDTTIYSIELTGNIPPFILVRLCHLFNNFQGQFEAKLKTYPETGGV